MSYLFTTHYAKVLIILERFIFTILALTSLVTTASADQWYPIPIKIWDPPFNSERKRIDGEYVALENASKRWKICVSIPNLKDSAWLAISYGIVVEARRLNVAVRISEAGGYENLAIQREQIVDCMATGADGLIVSAITRSGVDDLIEKYVDQGTPVVDLINGTKTERITARSAGTYWDNGYQVGQYLNKTFASQGKPFKIAWLPGPREPGWAKAVDKGFRDAIVESENEIKATLYGDLGRSIQSNLIENVLDKHHDLNVIVCGAVVANYAALLLRKRGLSDRVKVMSFYYSPAVHRGIRRGLILAAPSDLQVIQARMSVDTMVRILEGRSFFKHAGPNVVVVDQKNIRDFDASTSVAPAGFRAIFSVNDWVSNAQ